MQNIDRDRFPVFAATKQWESDGRQPYHGRLDDFTSLSKQYNIDLHGIFHIVTHLKNIFLDGLLMPMPTRQNVLSVNWLLNHPAPFQTLFTLLNDETYPSFQRMVSDFGRESAKFSENSQNIHYHPLTDHSNAAKLKRAAMHSRQIKDYFKATREFAPVFDDLLQYNKNERHPNDNPLTTMFFYLNSIRNYLNTTERHSDSLPNEDLVILLLFHLRDFFDGMIILQIHIDKQSTRANAVVMAAHPRLGRDAPISRLPADVLQRITTESFQ